MYLIVCNLALILNKPLTVFSQDLSSFCLSDTPGFSQSSAFLTYQSQFKPENISFFLLLSFFLFFFFFSIYQAVDVLWASLVAHHKESACNAGDAGDVDLLPELGRSSGEGNGNPLQCPCLENPMDRGA